METGRRPVTAPTPVGRPLTVGRSVACRTTFRVRARQAGPDPGGEVIIVCVVCQERVSTLKDNIRSSLGAASSTTRSAASGSTSRSASYHRPPGCLRLLSSG
jgi:hypothetical protein